MFFCCVSCESIRRPQTPKRRLKAGRQSVMDRGGGIHRSCFEPDRSIVRVASGRYPFRRPQTTRCPSERRVGLSEHGPNAEMPKRWWASQTRRVGPHTFRRSGHAIRCGCLLASKERIRNKEKPDAHMCRSSRFGRWLGFRQARTGRIADGTVELAVSKKHERPDPASKMFPARGQRANAAAPRANAKKRRLDHKPVAQGEGNPSMSERERWTIYPLLILALGASLKDKVVPPRNFEVDRLKCNQIEAAKANLGVAQAELATLVGATVQRLQVAEGDYQLLQARKFRIVGKDGSVRVLLGETETETGGGIQIYGNGDHPVATVVASPDGTSATVQIFNAEGQRRVALSTADQSGVISTFTGDDQLLVRVMFDRRGSGVIFTRDHDGKLRLLLGVPFTQEAPPHLNEEAQPEPPEAGDAKGEEKGRESGGQDDAANEGEGDGAASGSETTPSSEPAPAASGRSPESSSAGNKEEGGTTEQADNASP